MEISRTFISYASDILADTNAGLTASEICKEMSHYAVIFSKDIPHPRYPFDTPNKRTAFYKNLMVFDDPQKYQILKELLEHPRIISRTDDEVHQLRIRLITQYGSYDTGEIKPGLDENVIFQTRHWLNLFPDSLKLYNEAFQKYNHNIFIRNVLDDLRLSLEILLKQILKNDKSLENQISLIGTFIKDCGGSTELINMLVKLIDYYSKYQNTYVKHDDSVIKEEVEFIIEITSSFMKYFILLSGKTI